MAAASFFLIASHIVTSRKLTWLDAMDCPAEIVPQLRRRIMSILENSFPSGIDDLRLRIARRLDQLGFRVRNFRVAPSQGSLILHGRVRTYYCKQMILQVAMEVAQDVSERSIISNAIQVESQVA
jgi:hypothetical protein